MSERLTEGQERRIRANLDSMKEQGLVAATMRVEGVRALLGEIDALRHKLEQEQEAMQQLWAALFDGENPVDWLAEIETMKAAKAQLHEIGRTTHEVVEGLRKERDDWKADAETWRSEARRLRGAQAPLSRDLHESQCREQSLLDRINQLQHDVWKTKRERDEARAALKALWDDLGYTEQYFTTLEVERQVKAVLGEVGPLVAPEGGE